MLIFILQCWVAVKQCIFRFYQPSCSHVKPMFLVVCECVCVCVISSLCAVVREVHEGSEMFVFVLLAEFSARRRSQFLGAPRECISTDGGF